jgi:hypothetical protein
MIEKMEYYEKFNLHKDDYKELCRAGEGLSAVRSYVYRHFATFVDPVAMDGRCVITSTTWHPNLSGTIINKSLFGFYSQRYPMEITLPSSFKK